jgi:hypothetical protein
MTRAYVLARVTQGNVRGGEQRTLARTPRLVGKGVDVMMTNSAVAVLATARRARFLNCMIAMFRD